MFIKHDFPLGSLSLYLEDRNDDIWSGVLGTTPKIPSGAAFESFLQTVINYLQGFEWENLPHILPADSPISEVDRYAGKVSNEL